MYQLQSVTQTYERRGNVVTALDTCNIEIPDNDFIAIVGPSGSGKTTLLSILGGMMAPTSGSVSLDGLGRGQPHRRAGRQVVIWLSY